MALQVWLPLNGNLNNQGLANVSVTSGTAKYKTGKIGNGLDLSSRIMFSCPKLVGLKQFTIMFWVKIEDDDSIASNWQDIFGIYEQKADGSSYGQFRAETYYTPKTVGFLGVHWHDNFNYGITSGTLPTHYTGDRGVWHHCAIVVDSDQFIKSYTDGVLKNEYTTGLEGGHLYNGVFWLGETNNIAGCVNDVRIYDHILSPREVKEISKGLVLHYPLSMPGQENLVKRSNQFNVGSHAAKLTPSVLADGTYQVIAESGNSNYTSSWWMTKDGIEDSFVEGETFTISFTIKSSDANKTTPPTIYIKSGMGYYSMKGKVTDAWSTVYYTGTWKKENSLAPHLGWAGLVGTYHIMNWKIERGSRPTPWLPNPADTKYAALGFNDGIEYDVSGYRHNGTKVGSITYDSDTPRYNTSAVLDGSYITLTGITDSAISQFSVCGWVNLLTGYKPNFGCHLINFSKQYCRICISKDGAAVRLLLTDGTTNYFGSSAMSASGLSANVWNHYAVTFDNGSIKIYINGELDSSRTATITSISPGTSWTIGNYATELPKAKVSDVRFYTTCLNELDVRELYNTSMSLSDNGLLFGYEFIG